MGGSVEDRYATLMHEFDHSLRARDDIEKAAIENPSQYSRPGQLNELKKECVANLNALTEQIRALGPVNSATAAIKLDSQGIDVRRREEMKAQYTRLRNEAAGGGGGC